MSPTETIGTKPKASQPRSVRSKNHALMGDASIHPMVERTAFLGNGRQKHSLKAVEYRLPPGQASRPEEGVEVALYEGIADPPHLNPALDHPDGGRAVPPAVADLRSRLAASDGAPI